MNTYYWYNVAVSFSTEDEKTGKVKQVKENYLVKAVSPLDAQTQTEEDLAGTQMEWRIKTITETNIIRIIKPEDADLGLN